LKKKEEEARISKYMIQKLTEAKEDEHKRLSQELHDGVGQSLYSISIAMDNIMKRLQDDQLHDYIEAVRLELGKVMDDVKYYSQALRPKSLDQLGLVATIDSLIDSTKNKLPNTVFHFHYNFNDRLAPIIEINVYRAIQEALHNIMKYAQAKNVSIHLNKQNEILYVDISDDGIGFHVDKKQTRLGLLHIKERISQLAGSTAVKSAPGNGRAFASQYLLRRMSQMKVLIVDDHVLISKGIIMLLEGLDYIDEIIETDNGSDAITLAINHQPKIILMDLSMPDGLDGFTAAKNILSSTEQTKIIVLTIHDEEIYVKKAIEYNISGYLLKNSESNEIEEA